MPQPQLLVYRWNWLSSPSLTEETDGPPLICVVSHKSERESVYCGVYISILVYSKGDGEPIQCPCAEIVMILRASFDSLVSSAIKIIKSITHRCFIFTSYLCSPYSNSEANEPSFCYSLVIYLNSFLERMLCFLGFLPIAYQQRTSRINGYWLARYSMALKLFFGFPCLSIYKN